MIIEPNQDKTTDRGMRIGNIPKSDHKKAEIIKRAAVLRNKLRKRRDHLTTKKTTITKKGEKQEKEAKLHNKNTQKIARKTSMPENQKILFIKIDFSKGASIVGA
jgi:hypothetical protein